MAGRSGESGVTPQTCGNGSLCAIMTLGGRRMFRLRAKAKIDSMAGMRA